MCTKGLSRARARHTSLGTSRKRSTSVRLRCFESDQTLTQLISGYEPEADPLNPSNDLEAFLAETPSGGRNVVRLHFATCGEVH